MPVDKIDGAVLRNLDIGFDLVSREAVDMLETSEAMVIYLLLVTRPPNWIVRKQWILDRTGFGDFRYRKGRKELESKGFWTTANVKDDAGKLSGKVVWFSSIPRENAHPEALVSRTSENPHLRAINALKEQESIKEQENKDICANFSIFWSEYPKKRDKARSLKAFTKLNPDPDLMEKILTGLGKQKRSPDWTNDNGKFIPLPSTWLNGRRWEDDTDEEQDPFEGLANGY